MSRAVQTGMADFIYVFTTIAFFAIAVVYTNSCERL
jgi:hypothetical protein